MHYLCLLTFLPLQPMAYNREWDQGKGYWSEPAWNGPDAKPHVRQREENQYGEGKRRKFNNGVRLPLHYRRHSHSLQFSILRVSKDMTLLKRMVTLPMTGATPKITGMMSVRGEWVSPPRSVLHRPSLVHTLFFLDWTLISLRQMFVLSIGFDSSWFG